MVGSLSCENRDKQITINFVSFSNTWGVNTLVRLTAPKNKTHGRTSSIAALLFLENTFMRVTFALLKSYL